MTDDLEDSSQWRGSVESRLGTLETAAAGQQERLMQAISVTQSEHTTQLRAINGRLEKVEGKLETVEGRLEMVEGKLDLVHAGVEAIHTLLTGLTANETREDRQVPANPVDADADAAPDSLPRSCGETR